MVNPKSVNNLRNGSILIEVSNKKHVKILLKMKKFPNLGIKSYLYERLNISRVVVRNNDFSFCTIKEIKIELKKEM